MRSLNAPHSWWLLCDLRELKYDTYPTVGRATFVLHYQWVSRIYRRLPFALVSFEDECCNMAAIIDRIGILLFGLGPLGYDPFVSGIIFAEFSLIKKETSYRLEDLLLLVRVQGRGAIKVEQWFLNIFWLLLFLSGLFRGSWTVLLAKTSPELVTLNQLTPAKYNPSDLHGYFWNSIRAVLIMLAFENLR